MPSSRKNQSCRSRLFVAALAVTVRVAIIGVAGATTVTASIAATRTTTVARIHWAAVITLSIDIARTALRAPAGGAQKLKAGDDVLTAWTGKSYAYDASKSQRRQYDLKGL